MRRSKKTDKGRRKFLKLLAFGGLALAAARLFGSKTTALAAPVPSHPPAGGPAKKSASERIDIVDRDDEVVFVDKKTGEEILILEKD
jgi:hypothetical protein